MVGISIITIETVLFFLMEIPLLVRWHLYIETGPRLFSLVISIIKPSGLTQQNENKYCSLSNRSVTKFEVLQKSNASKIWFTGYDIVRSQYIAVYFLNKLGKTPKARPLERGVRVFPDILVRQKFLASNLVYCVRCRVIWNRDISRV